MSPKVAELIVRTGSDEAEKKAEDYLVKTLSKMGAPSNVIKAVQTARFTKLTRFSYPTLADEAVSNNSLMLISFWITYVFEYDDWCDKVLDEHSHGYLRKIESMEDNLKLLLSNIENVAQLSPQENIVSQSLAIIISKLSHHLTLNFQNWAKHNVEFINGVKIEREHRLKGSIPTVEEYKKLRPLISAVYPCLDLSYHFSEIDRYSESLPKEVKSSLQELELMANLHISQVNDIVSLPKELEEQTGVNIVVGLMHEQNLDLEQALLVAVKDTNQIMNNFFDKTNICLKLIDKSHEAYSTTIKTVQAMFDWMNGNYEWYKYSGRY